MAGVEKAITIAAPVEQIFDYVREATNLLEIWPNMVKIKDVQRLPNGGNRFRCVYRMAGIHFKVTSEDVEYIANQRIVGQTKGGIQSTIAWEFQPEDGGTNLTLKAEYTVPIPLLGNLAEALITRRNARDIEVLLTYLKIRVERGQA